jgi:hypothetical protein
MKKDMNFFSQFAGKRKGQSGSDLYVYLLGGVVAGAIILSLIVYSVLIFVTNKSIDNYQAELDKPETVEKINESNKVNEKIDALTRYDKELNIIISEVGSRNAVTTKLIEDLFNGRPDDIRVGSIEVNSKEVKMGCEATKKVSIAEFQSYLGKLSQVQSVYIGNIAGTDKFTFDIKCVLKKDVE